MRYLHTMLRVRNLDVALKFYCDALGLKEVRHVDNEKSRFTLVFLCAPDDEGVLAQSKDAVSRWCGTDLQLRRGGLRRGACFGHLAYGVDDIYATCAKLQAKRIAINRPPRDGQMAFVRSPDNHSIELLQKGNALAPQEPWVSMPNTGHW
ncbi:MAG: VOC family protein [Xanthobacteraceae bacterium]